MRRVALGRSVARGLAGALLAAVAATGPSTSARADVELVLDNVGFASGGSASGVFGLNVNSYLSSPISISVTDPTFGTVQYSGGSLAGSPPATDFDFQSAGYVYDLHLEFTQPVSGASTGGVSLVPGGGTLGGGYTGSYEECISSAQNCGTPYGTVDFITAGDALIPEPASVAVIGFGLLATAAGRRRWFRLYRD